MSKRGLKAVGIFWSVMIGAVTIAILAPKLVLGLLAMAGVIIVAGLLSLVIYKENE